MTTFDQEAALARVLVVARGHALYGDTLVGIQRVADAPLLTKAALAERFELMLEAGALRGGVSWSSSGGSGGKSLYFPSDPAENHEQRRRIARRLAASGVLGPDSVMLNLFPSHSMIRSLEIFNEFAELCGATTLPMPLNSGELRATEHASRSAHHVAEHFGANVLAGMPSRLLDFAHDCQRFASHKFDTILYGGEFLHPKQRESLRQRLSVDRFSAVYGGAETGIIGYAADVTDPPVYRVPRELAHIEVADPSDDGYGRLIVTNLVRLRHPLLRFDTRDLGRIVGEERDDVLIELHARDSDTFEFHGGYHELSRLAKVLDLYVEWQLVLDYDRTHRERACCCLLENSIDEADEINRLLEFLRRQLDPYGEVVVDVQLIPRNLFHSVGVSDKRPRLVDLRSVTST